MAHQGCPDEGTDTRLLGRWGCKIQKALSFHTQFRPIEFLFRFPFYFALVIPVKKVKFFSFRIGFRYDNNWPYEDGTGRVGGYIFPEAIIKVTNEKIY